jgi:hypothetical protein
VGREIVGMVNVKDVDTLVDKWMMFRDTDSPEPREITLTVRMQEDDYRLIEGLARYFGRRKSPVAAEILLTAAKQAAREVARRDSQGDKEREEEILDQLFGVTEESGLEDGEEFSTNPD